MMRLFPHSLRFSFILILLSSCYQCVDNLSIAKNEIDQNDFLGAIVRLNMHLKEHPQSDTAYFLRSHCYKSIWKDSLAELDVKKAIEINPNYFEAYLVLGKIRLSADEDSSAAAICFNKVFQSPNKELVSNAWIELGRMRYFSENIESAISSFSKAIEVDSSNAMAWYYHGLSKSRFFTAKGETGETTYPYLDFNEAIYDFSKTIELKPDLADAWFQRAMVRFNQFNDSLGMADVNKAIELAPAYSYYYLGRGHQHMLKNRFQLALSDLNYAIQKDPNDPNGFEERAQLYKVMENLSAAKTDSLTAEKLKIAK
jgi:tetratricopeptide (TPR) repeat protein